MEEARLNNEEECGQVRYIYPRQNNESSSSAELTWCAELVCANRTPEEEAKRRTVSKFILFIGGSVWFGEWIYTISLGKQWDGKKMQKLQPLLLEQVRNLMVAANRSIHDPVARQLLRNLSKDDSTTCYSPNCLHTGKICFCVQKIFTQSLYTVAGLSLLEAMNFSVDPCEDVSFIYQMI
jgi:hypothetical protein